MTLAGAASADAPDALVQGGYARLSALYKQPPSAAREARIDSELGNLIDYDAVAKRCFASDWAALNTMEQTEATGLVRDLVNRHYMTSLQHTAAFNMGFGAVDNGGPDAIVHAVATSVSKPRETVLIDFVVSSSAPFKVVDVAIEGSRLTTAYRVQFHRWLTTPGQGYPYLVQTIRTKLAQPTPSVAAGTTVAAPTTTTVTPAVRLAD